MEYVQLKKILRKLESGSREKGGSVSSGIPSLGAQHLNDKGSFKFDDMKYISSEHFDKMKTGKIEINDILIVKDGATTGKVSYVDSTFPYEYSAINEHVFKLTINERFLPKFVFWYLISIKGKNEILKDFRGATVGGISTKFVENVYLPSYSLETQKKIVEALDKAQELIDARKEQIRLMDELVKARFVEMFGDPVINPKGYLKKALIKECEIITGNTPSRQKSHYYGDFIEWIKSDNINTPSAFLTKASEYLSAEGLKVGRYVEADSILMTCIAGSLSCIGNIAIADRRVAFNQQINAIVPQKNNLWFMYVQFLLSKPYIQSTINMALKGILSKGQLSELKFIFPSLEKQNEFGNFVEKIEKAKLEIQSSLNEMNVTYEALVQQYFG